MPHWIKDFGFPPGGSLSAKILDSIQEKLHKRESEVEKCKTMTTALLFAYGPFCVCLQQNRYLGIHIDVFMKPI